MENIKQNKKEALEKKNELLRLLLFVLLLARMFDLYFGGPIDQWVFNPKNLFCRIRK